MELPDKPVVLFDGVCNLCSALVQFILRYDKNAKLHLSAIQSPSGQALLARFGRADVTPGAEPDTVFFLEGGRLYERSTAALRIARKLGGPWPLAYAFIVVPRFIRDAIYKLIARNRYRWFGKSESCRLAVPGELRALFALTKG